MILSLITIIFSVQTRSRFTPGIPLRTVFVTGISHDLSIADCAFNSRLLVRAVYHPCLLSRVNLHTHYLSLSAGQALTFKAQSSESIGRLSGQYLRGLEFLKVLMLPHCDRHFLY